MRRLVDLSASDPLTARAQLLVRALGPTVESEAQRHRVRRALDATSRTPARRWALPAVLAAGLLFASGAAATVALSRALLESAPAQAPARVVTEPKAAKPRPVSAAAPAVAGDRPSRAPDQEPPAPASPAARIPASNSDVARVHEAAKALRHDRDPERALELLERSRGTTFGPLAEEALALRIEASLASGNGGHGKLAVQYMKQYPHGRYRELVQRALADRKP
jgi:hypothetical protein